MRKHTIAIAATTLALMASLLAAPAKADRLYRVQLQTSALIGHAAGPFSLDFQFIDGDGIVNNAVSLTNFAFDGGSAVGAPTTREGSASGDLTAGIGLWDTSFFNELTQEFAPGNTLSFDLRVSESFAGGSPDSLTFAVLDRTPAELPTLGFFDIFFQIDLGESGPVVSSFGSDPQRAPAAGGDPLSIPAPTITAVATPEPGTAGLALFSCGLAPVLVRRKNPCSQRTPRL